MGGGRTEAVARVAARDAPDGVGARPARSRARAHAKLAWRCARMQRPPLRASKRHHRNRPTRSARGPFALSFAPGSSAASRAAPTPFVRGPWPIRVAASHIAPHRTGRPRRLPWPPARRCAHHVAWGGGGTRVGRRESDVATPPPESAGGMGSGGGMAGHTHGRRRGWGVWGRACIGYVHGRDGRPGVLAVAERMNELTAPRAPPDHTLGTKPAHREASERHNAGGG